MGCHVPGARHLAHRGSQWRSPKRAIEPPVADGPRTCSGVLRWACLPWPRSLSLPKIGERDAAAQGVAGDAAAGKAKAAVCAACHGPAGISVNPAWPSLAGQQPVYLAKQIRLFRDGERVELTMQPFVQNLSDQDIDDIAAYYASLSPCP